MSKFTSDPKIYNHSNNRPMSEVLEKELSRRGVLKGGAGLAALGLFSSFGLAGCSSSSSEALSEPELTLGFESIPGSKTDAVSVAEGYKAQVLAPWGTPLNSTASEWQDDGTNSSADQLNAVGMHHDGMHYFPLDGSSTEGLLCINHEYVDQDALHPNGETGATEASVAGGPRDTLVTAAPAEEARKEIYAHGVSVVHIRLVGGVWDVVEDSPYNRRITAATEMDVTGPVAGKGLLVTKYTTDNNKEDVARGTNNNCGNGHTPWGTYLTCEENWPGYFVHYGNMDERQVRIGISGTEHSSYKFQRYLWDTPVDASQDEISSGFFKRFDITPTGADETEDYRNEANGHGYIVEIDPYDPSSRAIKRTALGRFRHEDCSFGKIEEGKPVVFYSCHDGRFEYIYKFVSEKLWNPADAERTDRLVVGSEYMDAGTLYVARFNDEGKGEWIPLTPNTPASKSNQGGGSFTLGDLVGSQAQIILNTPLAADEVEATPMDRPEWTTVDPKTGAVYVALTNNTKRTEANIANPRLDNKFGHIIRWDEGESATEFTWDIFLFGAPVSAASDTNLSGLTEDNEFASPDGLVFDDRGILWVQTDNGASEVKDKTNDQMLAIIPSKLGDADPGNPVVNADNQDMLRRFFVGPNGCEVTGLAFTPDNQHFFLNIQHPSNWPYSLDAAEATPDGETVRPRAATVILMKEDGGEIGV